MNIPCGRVLGHGEACCEGYMCSQCEYILQLETMLDEAKEYLTQLLWVADDNGIHCGICHSEEYAADKHEPDCPAAALLEKLKGIQWLP